MVAVGVVEIRLAPKPGAVRGRFGEVEAEGRQPGVLGIDVGAFEIEDDVIQRLDRPGVAKFAHRQRRFPVRTLEPSISWERINDASKPELLKKLDRLDREFAVDGDLVEVHFLSNSSVFSASLRNLLSGCFSTISDR